MIYGLTGASGSGKTTLAQMTAETLSITYLPTSITECARLHGFEAVGSLELPDRIDLQYHLLNDLVEKIAKVNRPAILDRTPIDMIAYLLCEFDMHSDKKVNDADLYRVEAYVEQAKLVTTEHFDHVFFVHRLGFYEEAVTRPPTNPAYSVHTEIVMLGALATIESGVGQSIIRTSDLNERLDHVTDLIAFRLDGHQKSREKASLH